jgi:hypothetical protein
MFKIKQSTKCYWGFHTWRTFWDDDLENFELRYCVHCNHEEMRRYGEHFICVGVHEPEIDSTYENIHYND